MMMMIIPNTLEGPMIPPALHPMMLLTEGNDSFIFLYIDGTYNDNNDDKILMIVMIIVMIMMIVIIDTLNAADSYNDDTKNKIVS